MQGIKKLVTKTQWMNNLKEKGCQGKDHSWVTVLEESTVPHVASERCEDCGAFKRWVSKKEMPERPPKAILTMLPTTGEWELRMNDAPPQQHPLDKALTIIGEWAVIKEKEWK